MNLCSIGCCRLAVTPRLVLRKTTMYGILRHTTQQNRVILEDELIRANNICSPMGERLYPIGDKLPLSTSLYPPSLSTSSLELVGVELPLELYRGRIDSTFTILTGNFSPVIGSVPGTVLPYPLNGCVSTGCCCRRCGICCTDNWDLHHAIILRNTAGDVNASSNSTSPDSSDRQTAVCLNVS